MAVLAEAVLVGAAEVSVEAVLAEAGSHRNFIKIPNRRILYKF